MWLVLLSRARDLRGSLGDDDVFVPGTLLDSQVFSAQVISWGLCVFVFFFSHLETLSGFHFHVVFWSSLVLTKTFSISNISWYKFWRSANCIRNSYLSLLLSNYIPRNFICGPPSTVQSIPFLLSSVSCLLISYFSSNGINYRCTVS